MTAVTTSFFDASVPPARGSAASTIQADSLPAGTPVEAAYCDRPADPASCLPIDPVRIECELREAVQSYSTEDELTLAIDNAKIMSGIAPLASDRALCLQRLLALHDRRRALQL